MKNSKIQAELQLIPSLHQKALEGEICVKRRTANNAFIVIWIKANAKQPPWYVVASAVVFAIRLSISVLSLSLSLSPFGDNFFVPEWDQGGQQQLHKNQQTLKWIVVHTNKPVLSDCVISDETMLGSHNDESNKMFEVFE